MSAEGIAVLDRPAAATVPVNAQVWRAGVYALSTLVTVAFTLLSGKDLNWDALNYHYYAGFSALNDRFAIDFIAASFQAYFNPYAHVPFYLMVRAGIPSLAIATVFALVHSLMLWLTYEFALALSTSLPSARRQGVAIVAVAMAALNPIFLQQVGSTFADVTTGILVLGSWLALARAFQRPVRTSAAVAGALAGVAVALKLSNAVFAIAAVPVLLFLPGGWWLRLRLTAVYLFVCGVTFLAVAAPWSARLWQEFGNPFFPFFNGLFKSPEFIVEPLRHMRFLPESLSEALWRPVALMLPDLMVHSELRAPDVRYAALLATIVAAVAVVWVHRANGIRKDAALAWDTGSFRALVATTAGFVLAWSLWLRLSGNGRYFLPMACVAGALIAVWFARLLKRTDWLVLALGLTVVLQAAEISLGSRLRWSPMEWQGEWFRVKISERLQREPVLYLSMSTTTGAFLAPFVAPGSGMMNISGAYTLAPDGPGGARAVALIDRFGTRLRTLDRVTRKLKDGTPLALPADITDTRLQRFGLRVDPDDCEFISYEDSPGLEAGSALAFDRRGQRETNYYQTCAIRRDGVDLKAYMAERAAIDKVLDRVEDACPDLFRPRRMMTEHNGPTWRRVYVNTDNELWIWDGWIKYLNGVLGGVPLVIGPASEWEQGPRAIDCSRKSALGGSALIESR